MFLTTLLSVITLIISKLFFQLSMIERITSETHSNLLEFPFDYVPRSLFIGKGLIIEWISLIETKVNSHPYEHAIGENDGNVENISPYGTTAVTAAFMGLDPIGFCL